MTHDQLNVLDLSLLEEGSAIAPEELETLSRNMALSLRQLVDQRDKGREVPPPPPSLVLSIRTNPEVFDT